MISEKWGTPQQNICMSKMLKIEIPRYNQTPDMWRLTRLLALLQFDLYNPLFYIVHRRPKIHGLTGIIYVLFYSFANYSLCHSGMFASSFSISLNLRLKLFHSLVSMASSYQRYSLISSCLTNRKSYQHLHFYLQMYPKAFHTCIIFDKKLRLPFWRQPQFKSMCNAFSRPRL